MTITIKDVARIAGVSISTVSRVINNSKPVSEEIRDRVLKVVKETNYVPNPVARSLVLRKSNTIGVIVPDISDFKVGEILNGVEEVARLYNYDILLCNSYGELKEEKKYIELLKSKQVAGIVFISWDLTDSTIKLLSESYIPTIYISKNAHKFDVPYIGIDHAASGITAGEYVISKGFKQVAIFEAKEHNEMADTDIIVPFTNLMKKNKIKCSTEIFITSKNKVNESYEFMEKYIENHKKLPEFIFTTSDDVAVGIINALLDNNIDVPEKVSVMGHDDSKIGKIIRPKLTTISQPLYDMGAIAIGVLIKKVEGIDDGMETKILKHEIVERNSVK